MHSGSEIAASGRANDRRRAAARLPRPAAESIEHRFQCRTSLSQLTFGVSSLPSRATRELLVARSTGATSGLHGCFKYLGHTPVDWALVDPDPSKRIYTRRRTIDPPSQEDTRVRLRRYNPRCGRRACSTARIRGFACRRDCDPSVRSRRRWQRPLAPNCPDPRSRGDHRNRFRGVHSGHRLNHPRGPLNRLARHRRVSR